MTGSHRQISANEVACVKQNFFELWCDLIASEVEAGFERLALVDTHSLDSLICWEF